MDRVSKILHIANDYHGTKLYSRLFNALDFAGISNCVYDPLHNRSHVEEVISTNLIIKKCFNSLDRILFYTKQNKMMKEIEKYFKVASFDIIHAHTLFSGGYSAYKINQKYGIPYIVAVRDTDVNTFFKYMWHLRGVGVEIMRSASAVIFLSPTYRDFVIDKYVLERCRKEILDKSYVIPNGIDDFWLNNLYSDRDDLSISKYVMGKKLRVLSVGTISKRKNLIVVAKAVDILRSEGWDIKYTIIGEVCDMDIYSELVNKYNVGCIDRQSKEVLKDYYDNNDVFVLASKTETFGLVYAEAMSQGLPVLYSEGQGFDGQFAEGEVGYHVDSRDPKDIAKKIKLVCQNYSYVSSNALKKVVKFRWSDIAKQYVELYCKSLK